MAKRPTPRSRSQADDGSGAATEQAQPRTRRSRVSPAGNPTDTAVASTMATTDEVTAADMGPTEEDIRRRAYERYLQRGGGHGMDFDDWLEAERELRSVKSKV